MTDEKIATPVEHSEDTAQGAQPVVGQEKNSGKSPVDPKNMKINGSVASGVDEQKVEPKDLKKMIDMPSNRKNLAIVVFLALVFAGFLAGMTYFI